MLNRKLMMGNMPCDRRCQVVPGVSCNSVGWRVMHGSAVRRLEGVGWGVMHGSAVHRREGVGWDLRVP